MYLKIWKHLHRKIAQTGTTTKYFKAVYIAVLTTWNYFRPEKKGLVLSAVYRKYCKSLKKWCKIGRLLTELNNAVAKPFLLPDLLTVNVPTTEHRCTSTLPSSSPTLGQWVPLYDARVRYYKPAIQQIVTIISDPGLGAGVSDVTLHGHLLALKPNTGLLLNTSHFLQRNGSRKLCIFTVPLEWKIKHIQRPRSACADQTDHDLIPQGWIF